MADYFYNVPKWLEQAFRMAAYRHANMHGMRHTLTSYRILDALRKVSYEKA